MQLEKMRRHDIISNWANEAMRAAARFNCSHTEDFSPAEIFSRTLGQLPSDATHVRAAQLQQRI
jgi:hypothetical protein